MGRVLNGQYDKLKPAFIGSSTSSSYSGDVRNLLQDKIDDKFTFAGDYYIIEKQNNITGAWNSIGCRVTSPYTISQSSTIKDDFKTLLFQNDSESPVLGDAYRFNGFTYLCVDTGKSLSPTVSCLIQRCGDSLRWYNDLGVYREIPCIIGKVGIYDLDESMFLSLPENQMIVNVAYNTISREIKWADPNSATDKFTRFLLKQMPYRTTSLDPHKMVRNNFGIMEVRLQMDLLKPTDNLVTNIADDIQGVTVEIVNGASTSIGVSQTAQLVVQVKRNGVLIDNPVVTYSSADGTKVSVNSNGLITGISSGTTNITATYAGVSDIIAVTVASVVNNYSVEFTSTNNKIDSIRIGETTTYTSIPKNNGVTIVDTGTWTITDDTGLVPSTKCTIVSQTGNSVVVKAVNSTANAGSYVRVYFNGTLTSGYIRLQIKSIF